MLAAWNGTPIQERLPLSHLIVFNAFHSAVFVCLLYSYSHSLCANSVAPEKLCSHPSFSLIFFFFRFSFHSQGYWIYKYLRVVTHPKRRVKRPRTTMMNIKRIKIMNGFIIQILLNFVPRIARYNMYGAHKQVGVFLLILFLLVDVGRWATQTHRLLYGRKLISFCPPPSFWGRFFLFISYWKPQGVRMLPFHVHVTSCGWLPFKLGNVYSEGQHIRRSPHIRVLHSNRKEIQKFVMLVIRLSKIPDHNKQTKSPRK